VISALVPIGAVKCLMISIGMHQCTNALMILIRHEHRIITDNYGGHSGERGKSLDWCIGALVHPTPVPELPEPGRIGQGRPGATATERAEPDRDCRNRTARHPEGCGRTMKVRGASLPRRAAPRMEQKFYRYHIPFHQVLSRWWAATCRQCNEYSIDRSGSFHRVLPAGDAPPQDSLRARNL
jgi:hypothetical protein